MRAWWHRWRDRIADGAIQGAAMGLVFVLLLVILAMMLGGQQQSTLTEIRNATRAEVCVLILPVSTQGRDEAAVNRRCLIPNGIAPVDADGNGRVEGDNP